ncbi:MAG TPA: TIGR02266 family protein [Thermodesulfobacteriota bacterium]
MDDRRRWPRAALVAEITLAADSPPILRQITDLSHGGLFVDSPTPLPEGTAVRLRFALPGQTSPMTIEARVAWTQPHIGMGLRFTKLHPADKRAIDQYVDETLRRRST